MVNFVRDGRVGDEVSCKKFGNGFIVTVDRFHRQVQVEFESGSKRWFDSDGSLSIAFVKVKMLCWGHEEDYTIELGVGMLC